MAWERSGYCPTCTCIGNALTTLHLTDQRMEEDPLEASICDDDGHPLTWGRVRSAHAWLARHATCAGASSSDANGYDSDGDRCPCTYHPAAIEERESHMRACHAWPGHICGVCWAASCQCGFVFDEEADAHSRWPTGQLRCAGCAP